MGRKPVLLPVYVTKTGTSQTPVSISLATAFTTIPTNVQYEDNTSYQINVTTTNSIGTFTVEVCSDYNPNIAASGNWSNMGTAASPNAANGIFFCEIVSGPRSWIRLNYAVGTAGTGTCTILVSAKNIGA